MTRQAEPAGQEQGRARAPPGEWHLGRGPESLVSARAGADPSGPVSGGLGATEGVM